MALLPPFKINETLKLTDLNKLTKLINEDQLSFCDIVQTGTHSLKFKNKISIGTMSLNNMFVESISIEAKLILKDGGNEITFYNSPRIDGIFITFGIGVLVLVLFILQIFKGSDIPYWINFGILPLVVLLFNWVYYAQEWSLLVHIKNALLKEGVIDLS